MLSQSVSQSLQPLRDITFNKHDAGERPQLSRARSSLKRTPPPINDQAPTLTKKDYYTIPSIKKLRRMSSESLKVRPVSISSSLLLQNSSQSVALWCHARLSSLVYFTHSICAETLQRCTKDEVVHLNLQAVDRFVIGHSDLGEVQFLLPVDLLGLDFDSIVDIDKGKIQVYGLEGQSPAPPPGQGLNMPAMLVFRCLILSSI